MLLTFVVLVLLHRYAFFSAPLSFPIAHISLEYGRRVAYSSEPHLAGALEIGFRVFSIGLLISDWIIPVPLFRPGAGLEHRVWLILLPDWRVLSGACRQVIVACSLGGGDQQPDDKYHSNGCSKRQHDSDAEGKSVAYTHASIVFSLVWRVVALGQ